MREDQMARHRNVVALVAIAAALAASAARGQSLAEIAEREKEKREARKAAGAKTKTYSDQDLETYAGEKSTEKTAEGEPAAMSATPKEPAAKASERPEARDEPEADSTQKRAAEAERVRARWRAAKAQVARAEERLRIADDALKALPPGLPRGNYMQDIKDAVAAQRAAQEQAQVEAKQALDAAKELVDAVETEARRKSIRLD
jgi:hypothetical protein